MAKKKIWTPKYRALFVSDVHMSNSLPHAVAGPDGITDRLLDQEKLWVQIAQVAREQKVDSIEVLGDLFDASLADAATLRYTGLGIRRAAQEAPVRILAGNHELDCANLMITDGATAWADGNVSHVKRESIAVAPGLRFWYFPWASPEETQAALIGASKDFVEGEYNVALGHCSVLGCRDDDWVCDKGGVDPAAFDDFDRGYLGHFHTHQRFGSSKHVMYLSAPMHLNYKDVDRQACFWVVEFDGAEVHEFAFPGSTPVFHEYAWEEHAGYGPAEYVESDLPLVGEDDYVRISVRMTRPEWAKTRLEVDELVARLRARGYRAKSRFSPVHQHEKRLTSAARDAGISLADGPGAEIRAYVSSDGVSTKGLDPGKLLDIGMEIFRESGNQ